MHFSCTVRSLGYIVSAEGFREGSGCYELANPRFPQGPAEVSGLCHLFTTFYSQLQSASRSFDCLNLHQDCLQVVQCSGCCILQIQKALFQLPSLLPLIRPGSLWWRLMRQRWGLMRFYPSVLSRTARCILARIFLTVCLPQSVIMTLATESCWLSSLPW